MVLFSKCFYAHAQSSQENGPAESAMRMGEWASVEYELLCVIILTSVSDPLQI